MRVLLACAISLLCPVAWSATGSHEIQTCTTTGTGPYTSAAFTPAAGDMLVVMAAVSDTAATATLSSSVGTTFSIIAPFSTAAYRTSLDRVYVFIANTYSTAVSQTVTISVSGDPGTGACIAVLAVQGMKRLGQGAVRDGQAARQQNQAGGGTPAPAFASAVLTANATVGVIGNNSNPAAMTPPSGWTEGSTDGGYATPTTGFEYVFRASGFTGTTVTWGSTSASTFASFILELDTSGCETSNFGTLMGVGCQ